MGVPGESAHPAGSLIEARRSLDAHQGAFISLASLRAKVRLWHLAALVLAAWAVRYVGFPLGADQGILLWVGDVIRGGGLPYRDAFDIRGPGFDYLHALILVTFGRNEWGIRVFDLLAISLGGWLVWRIARRVAGPVAASASTVLFLLWYAALDYWSTAQSDGWCAVILSGVVALLVIEEKDAKLWRTAAAGMLIALCVLNKPLYAMFLLLPAVRVLAQRDRGAGWMVSRWGAIGAGFAAPILVCAAWFAAHGALDDLSEVHIRWTLSTYSGLSQPWLTRVQATVGWILTSKFAVALGVAVGGLVFLARTRRTDAVVIGLWLGLALLTVVAQARYWQYHWLVIYSPLAVLAGMGVHALTRLRAMGPTSPTNLAADREATLALRSMPVAVMAVLFGAAFFSPSLEAYRWVKAEVGLTNMQEYDRMQYGIYGRGPNTFVDIARYIASRTSERDEVLVWGNVQGINFLSARRSATRFAYPRALTNEQDTQFRPRYLREFFDDLRAGAPTYVVAIDERWCDVVLPSGPNSTDHIAYPLRCLNELPELQRFIEERYTLERQFLNSVVFRLREVATPPANGIAATPWVQRAHRAASLR